MRNEIYLKNLNSIRAIAAISVMLSHINLELGLFNLPAFETIDLGGFGVTIFFSLSGFLITYLLLNENTKGGIGLKSFYIRRMLRIWPLYFFYLSLVIGTLYIYAPNELSGTIVYYFFLSANIPFILGTSLNYVGHFWSLGVEEQFYIFWPLLIKFSKKLKRNLILFVVIFISARVLFRCLEIKYGYSAPYRAIHVTRFDCMAIGGLGALFFFNKNRIFLRLLQTKLAQFIAWTAVFLMAINKFHIASVLDQEIIAALTIVIIINTSCNPNPIVSLKSKILNFIGSISFGIYVYHPLIIFYLSRLLNEFYIEQNLKYFGVYFLVPLITIFISWLSFKCFEEKFLKLKPN